MKAKLEPRNAGTLNFDTRWNTSVPMPANSSVALTLRPVMMGTRMVAPNMAKRCCTPRRANLGLPRLRASVMPMGSVFILMVMCVS